MRPDAFAAVMATAIVSIAAADHGFDGISQALVVLAGAGLVLLAGAGMFAWRREPLDFATPETPIALLTFVAGCAVVGTRLNWLTAVHVSLAVLALVGHVRDGGRNGLAVADEGVAGGLLDRTGRMGYDLLRSAAAISPITRCGCSVRSNHVNRNTCQPFSEMWFCRARLR